MAYYKELTEVPNTGGEVYVHRIEASAKGNWYVRIKRLNSPGYFKKSLKTTDLFEAMKRANRYWIQVREAEEQHIVLAPKNNFKSLLPAYFAYRRKRSTEYVVRALECQFARYYTPYFGSWNVGNITEQSYRRYLNDHRLVLEKHPTIGKRPTLKTLDTEQSNLITFINWCFTTGNIRIAPRIGKIIRNPSWVDDMSLVNTHKPQRREMVSPELYASVREFLRYEPRLRPRDTYESDFHEVSRRRLHFYIITMYNFVCRAGEELLRLQFKHFEIQQSEIQKESYYMVMRTPYGKKMSKMRMKATSDTRVLSYFSDYNYVEYWATWIEFLQSKGFPTGPEDYVFPVRKRKGKSKYHKDFESYDKYPGEYWPFRSQNAAAQLRRVKPDLKAWCGERGRLTPRMEAEIDMFSAYSVRHLAIRQLIVESGYDITRAAERANTGVKMIEDFYYKYGVKPEGRIVSKHPDPSPKNTKTHDAKLIERLSEITKVKKAKTKKRDYE